MTTQAAAIADRSFGRLALDGRPARRQYGALRELTGDALSLLAVAFAIPLIVLAVGMPVVLTVRLLLWLVGLL